MITPNRLIALLCMMSLTGGPCWAASADESSPPLPENSGMTPLKSVIPQFLTIQDIATKKEMCAQIVTIADPAKACKVSKCLTPFNYGEKIAEPMKAGVRGIYVDQCESKMSARRYLLWGPENLLILNTARAPEKDFWIQTKHKSQKAIEFATEASSGKLYMKDGKFEWAEAEN